MTHLVVPQQSMPLLCICVHYQILLYTSTSNTPQFRVFILAYKCSKSSNKYAWHVLSRKTTLSETRDVLQIQQMGMLNAETEITALFAIATLFTRTSFYLLSKSDQKKANWGKHWVWGGEDIQHFQRKQLITALTNALIKQGLLWLN